MPAVIVTVPLWLGVMLDCVNATLMPESDCSEASVTFVDPLVIFGCRRTLPLAGTVMTSGFKSHSEAGVWAMLPLTMSSVAEYGAKLTTEDHAWDEDAAMAVGALAAKV